MKSTGLGGFGKGLSLKPMVATMMSDNDMDMDDMDPMDFKPNFDDVGDFIGRLLMSAPMVHMLHLQTDSYAKHKALNKLYDSLPDDIDSVIEEFQGLYGIVPSYATYAPFNANPITFVAELADFVRSNRGCLGPCKSLQANVDILQTSIHQTLYKLKNLS